MNSTYNQEENEIINKIVRTLSSVEYSSKGNMIEDNINTMSAKEILTKNFIVRTYQSKY